jgi:hypothetical protein
MTEGSAEELPPPRRPRWGRRIGVAFLVLGAALLGLILAWARTSTRAYVDQLSAYRAAGEPTSVEELNAWAALVTPGDNAVPALREAAASIDGTTEAAEKMAYRSTDQWTPPLRDREVREIDALVKENARALELLEKAVGLPGVDWEPAYVTPMMSQLFPDLTPQTSLASLVRWKMVLEHHRGNDAEALRCAQRLLFMGRAVDHQPTLVSHLVAVGIGARAADGAAQVAPDLRIAATADAAEAGAATPEQVRALIGEFLDERALAEGQRRSWAGERVMQIDSVNALADGKMLGPSPGVAARAKLPFVRPYFYDNGRVMTAHTTALMRATESSPDLPTFRQKLPDQTTIKSSPRYLLASILVPSLDRAGEQHYRLLANRRLAATVLACRWFAVDHDGRLPRTLDELVPHYLPAVPIDPLAADGKPLGYVSPEKDPDKPRVYSVGPNGIDQGGAEPDPSLPRREYEARRDEVRHLKRQPRPEPTEEEEEAAEPGGVPQGTPEPQRATPEPQPGA